MTIEILPNIFQLEVPLHGNPLKSLNSYLIKGNNRHLIIDTGFNRPECKNAIISSLEKLKISLEDCDFFLTHLHADHTGLVSSLATNNSRIFCSKEDGILLNMFESGEYWTNVSSLLSSHGFPPDELITATQKHPAKESSPGKQLELSYIENGATIEIGEYSFICILTPGHSPGHMCLYEPKYRLLISGDHILARITPNITVWPQMPDALSQYLHNLDKILELEIDLVLPGHRSLIYDCPKRIEEIKNHHQERLEELLGILNSGPLTAYQAASKMTWSLTYTSWGDFPMIQKWFATGEAASHLEYLAQQQKVQKDTIDGKSLFSLI
ncbi:MAG: MBL fold metallo-hydrolase [Firmicutes bacterium HGW-Firmicutes-12]|jgi:glyoxylase-like metal-dependent hydrolase (beta-lactamase superfamily II)|nr:MAG: MBL fold metallo-hydrolase [Firmicutes bacterium HGW-Firmicutes-12]